MGSSKPWPDVIRTLTRGRTDRMEAGAILEFFQPLTQWLRQQNQQQPVGWSPFVATKLSSYF